MQRFALHPPPSLPLKKGEEQTGARLKLANSVRLLPLFQEEVGWRPTSPAGLGLGEDLAQPV